MGPSYSGKRTYTRDKKICIEAERRSNKREKKA
jgi:hypothetical protein